MPTIMTACTSSALGKILHETIENEGWGLSRSFLLQVFPDTGVSVGIYRPGHNYA